jgi:hypothetical protein
MYLPVRLATSLPIAIVFVGALAIDFSQPDGRQLHPVYGYPNAFLFAFLAAIPSLLLVLPNVAGAVAANRFGQGEIVSFALIFAAVSFAVLAAEAAFLHNVFKIAGPPLPYHDWRLYAVLLANVVIMVLVAAWHSRSA